MLYAVKRMFITVGLIFAPMLGSEFVWSSANKSEKLACRQYLSDCEQHAPQKKFFADQSIPGVPDKTYAFASLNNSLESNSESESFESTPSSSTQSVYQENVEEALNNGEITTFFVLRNNYWFAMSAKQAQIYCSHSQCRGIMLESIDKGDTTHTYAYILPNDKNNAVEK